MTAAPVAVIAGLFARNRAKGLRSGGARLNKAFQKAFNVAKHIRTDTNIQRGSVSVGSVAVARRIVFADFGADTAIGFTSAADLGLGVDCYQADDRLADLLAGETIASIDIAGSDSQTHRARKVRAG